MQEYASTASTAIVPDDAADSTDTADPPIPPLPGRAQAAMSLMVLVPTTLLLSVPYALSRIFQRVSTILTPRRRGRCLDVPQCAVPADGLGEIFSARRPVILKDFARRWQAFDSCTPESLRERHGDQRIHVMHSRGGDFLQQLATMVEMSYAECLDAVFGDPETKTHEGSYYFWGGDSEEFHAEFETNAAGRKLQAEVVKLWIGEQGNVTRLHYDWWHGCLAQVRGRKRVLLFPPDQATRIYASPFYASGAPTRLPPQCADADPERYPLLDTAERYEAVVEEGDALYIPPYWWHEVECLDPCLSVPVRYSQLSHKQLRPPLFPFAWQLMAGTAAAAFGRRN